MISMISRQENCKNVKFCSSFDILTPLSNVFEVEFFPFFGFFGGLISMLSNWATLNHGSFKVFQRKLKYKLSIAKGGKNVYPFHGEGGLLSTNW